MNDAAARAAIRRGSSMTIRPPASHGACSNANGTWVVLPAPGGASSTRRGRSASEATISGSSGEMGKTGLMYRLWYASLRPRGHVPYPSALSPAAIGATSAAASKGRSERNARR